MARPLQWLGLRKQARELHRPTLLDRAVDRIHDIDYMRGVGATRRMGLIGAQGTPEFEQTCAPVTVPFPHPGRLSNRRHAVVFPAVGSDPDLGGGGEPCCGN